MPEATETKVWRIPLELYHAIYAHVAEDGALCSTRVGSWETTRPTTCLCGAYRIEYEP